MADHPKRAPSAEPPEEVRSRGLCGPLFRKMFPIRDDEGRIVRDKAGKVAGYVDIPELLMSSKPPEQKLAVSLACAHPCPVRFACARWAVATRQTTGSWGMPQADVNHAIKAVDARRKAAEKAAAARAQQDQHDEQDQVAVSAA